MNGTPDVHPQWLQQRPSLARLTESHPKPKISKDPAHGALICHFLLWRRDWTHVRHFTGHLPRRQRRVLERLSHRAAHSSG